MQKAEFLKVLQELSNCKNDENTENMIIHGDNLLALKVLESKYAGKIKCIYIDPSYNAESSFEHYDDRLEILSYGELPYKLSKEKFFSGQSLPINRGHFMYLWLIKLQSRVGMTHFYFI